MESRHGILHRVTWRDFARQQLTWPWSGHICCVMEGWQLYDAQHLFFWKFIFWGAQPFLRSFFNLLGLSEAFLHKPMIVTLRSCWTTTATELLENVVIFMGETLPTFSWVSISLTALWVSTMHWALARTLAQGLSQIYKRVFWNALKRSSVEGEIWDSPSNFPCQRLR